jgi:hypothetical protein
MIIFFFFHQPWGDGHLPFLMHERETRAFNAPHYFFFLQQVRAMDAQLFSSMKSKIEPSMLGIFFPCSKPGRWSPDFFHY